MNPAEIDAAELPRRKSSTLVGAAVQQNSLFSIAGLNERAFTFAFSSLVYPQIWEDPVVDLEALRIESGHRVITIASGGCNALSYLVADPAEIIAVDLNASHAALNRLKNAALRHLPDYDSFYAFLGAADKKSNVELFDTHISDRLDDATRTFWNSRDVTGRRNVERFARGFYRYGLLGRFIAAGHFAAKLYGRDPRIMLKATSLEEQREIYARELKPLFEKRAVRAILNLRSSLFGLGIPPAQYDALSGGRPMHEVVEERLARLACGFDLKDNYFAWQAFNRGYAPDEKGPLPIYLQPENYEAIRARASRIQMRNISYTEQLRALPAQHLDRYVLLDAQDWMNDAVLTELWTEITRTARPGARVIFRTAGEESILPGRIPDTILNQWTYEDEASRAWVARDRSAIYGGFHLYVMKDKA
ncbi:MAG: S-adenosylmethionine--diacylglycerol 3-amino-3-carboxypropyl transferase [Hyphomicrobium sp. 32-62-53]|nr:MAG: S-adenosylmethionine--diacylglycerol 3-amino-3-carboxypropyl transferase [Hyphomicrobium sp. 12-62-95]OYY01905.1 MAG: S-adenosylmethionine--diacylglycerol 3-amino-3-carboxypropyl transferase [Hyphomicrobium sp. 32-62-53]